MGTVGVDRLTVKKELGWRALGSLARWQAP